MSNRFNLKTYFAINAFNADSVHRITIKINDKIFFEKELEKNKEHKLKVSNYFDFIKPSLNTIDITWDGDRESADKFMKIYKTVINDQHIASYKVMMDPKPNEYIKNLMSTEEGLRFYKEKMFNPGHHFGWYGNYKFRFMIDPPRIQDQTQLSLIESCGIQTTRVFTDTQKARLYNKVRNA